MRWLGLITLLEKKGASPWLSTLSMGPWEKKTWWDWNWDSTFLQIWIHPGRLTWNLQITRLERKMIFQTSMIMFHVNLQGCTVGNILFVSSRCWKLALSNNFLKDKNMWVKKSKNSDEVTPNDGLVRESSPQNYALSSGLGVIVIVICTDRSQMVDGSEIPKNHLWMNFRPLTTKTG